MRRYGLLLSLSYACSDATTLAEIDADTRERIDAGLPVDVVVTLQTTDPAARARALDCAGITDAQVRRQWDRLPMVRASLPAEVAQRLSHCPDVATISHPPDVRAATPEAVPLIGAQPGGGHDGLTGAGQTVVVLDGGMDVTAPQFGACVAPGIGTDCQVAFGYDFEHDTFDVGSCGSRYGDHGTYMSSIIDAVAPEVDLIFMKVDDDDCAGPGFSGMAILESLAWVVDHGHRYDVAAINLSFATDPFLGVCDDDIDPAFRMVMDQLVSDGVLMIAASGNGYDPNDVGWPACHSGAVAVAAGWDAEGHTCPLSSATGLPREMAPYSNSGALIEVVAPGSVVHAGGFEDCGTSQASAFVTGAVALMAEASPHATAVELRAALSQSSTTTDDARGLHTHSFPFLDVPKAIEAVGPQPSLEATAMVRRQPASIIASGFTPAGSVSFWASASAGSSPCPPSTDPSCLDLDAPTWLGEGVADANGTATLTLTVPQGVPATVQLQASQDGRASTVVHRAVP